MPCETALYPKHWSGDKIDCMDLITYRVAVVSLCFVDYSWQSILGTYGSLVSFLNVLDKY